MPLAYSIPPYKTHDRTDNEHGFLLNQDDLLANRQVHQLLYVSLNYTLNHAVCSLSRCLLARQQLDSYNHVPTTMKTKNVTNLIPSWF